MGEREVVLGFTDDEGGCTKIFLKRFAAHADIGILDDRVQVEPFVEPFVEFIRLHAYACPFVDFGGKRFHEAFLVRYAEFVLALVPRQPVIHGCVVKSRRVDRAAFGNEPFDVRDELCNQGKGIGSRCKIFQVVHLVEKCGDSVDLLLVAAEPFFQVLPHL